VVSIPTMIAANNNAKTGCNFNTRIAPIITARPMKIKIIGSISNNGILVVRSYQL
jgi:hypothetical protein